jgi:hypothetical protein
MAIDICDVIVHAAVNSGLMPSFNLPELPPDVQSLSKEVLTKELIPQMNCDRTLDLDVKAERMIPLNGKIRMAHRSNAGPADYAVNWVPGRVDAVLEESSRVPYQYLYRTEFESIGYRCKPFIYCTEQDEFGLSIFLKNAATPKRVIFPVPIHLADGKEEIIAPQKFYQYIVDSLAVRLAVIYGMSTAQMMGAAQQASYNNILKQVPQPLHAANPRERIRDILNSGQSKQWRADGFV